MGSTLTAFPLQIELHYKNMALLCYQINCQAALLQQRNTQLNSNVLTFSAVYLPCLSGIFVFLSLLVFWNVFQVVWSPESVRVRWWITGGCWWRISLWVLRLCCTVAVRLSFTALVCTGKVGRCTVWWGSVEETWEPSTWSVRAL